MSFRRFDSDTDQLNYQFDYNNEESAALRERFSTANTIGLTDLNRVVLWKIDRVIAIPEELLATLSALRGMKDLDISSTTSRDIIDRLTKCEGIFFPMASAILKFVQPNVYPIIDVRAYRAAYGQKPYRHTYTVDRYVEYARDLRKVAEQKGIPFPEVDEQLYCFDVDKNGKL